MKKGLKIIAFVFLFLVAMLFVIPFFFEDKIIEVVKKTANKNLNATFDFNDVNLSILKSFPNAELTLNEVSVVNTFPFEGDTLFKAQDIILKLPIKQLFGSISELNITNFAIDRARLQIKIDENGRANYDIVKESNSDKDTLNADSKSLKLELDSYKITNSEISYADLTSKIELKLSDFNHSGNGNLSSEKSDLDTETSTIASFSLDSVVYLKNNQLALDAVIGIDLTENTYTFLENKLQINQLPLVFDGFVKVNKENQEFDITFKTPSSDFKNFLALIPEVYSKNLDGVTTTGNFDVKGSINGVMDENYIPKFDILINSKNASFKYADLPKTIENIHINTEIGNKTGITKDTYVVIDTLSFKIDEDVFNASAKVTELTGNPIVFANLRGNINLANLEKVYPADAVKNLKGKLYVNAKANFDMQSVEKKQFEKTNVSGNFALSDFVYNDAGFKDPLQISKAEVTLNPEKVTLNNFDAKVGNTDLSAQGKINNLLGFFFKEEEMEGVFDLASTKFVVNDFMSSEPKDTLSQSVNATSQSIKIPSFLNATINAKAQTVVYDEITLKNVSGTLLIKDQKAVLKDMKSSVFDGLIGFTGNVNTKDNVPTFEMDLDFGKINVAESFAALDLFQAIAPIATAINGQLNSSIKMTGNLNQDFSPDLNSLNGSVSAQLLSSNLETEKIPVLQLLEQNLDFLDTKKLNLDNLKMNLNFENGKVVVNPFTVNYRDIKVDVSGGHGFDNSMDYNAKIHVPVKYLGKDASKFIAKMSEQDQEKIEIPVNALIAGTFKKPVVTTDVKAAVSNLAQQLAEKQTDKLVEQGKEKIANAIDDFIKKNEKTKDSTIVDTVKTNKNATEDVVKDVLNSIFSTKKKKKDSIK
jgi:hypothetical protein